jgi:hypothetical protein
MLQQALIVSRHPAAGLLLTHKASLRRSVATLRLCATSGATANSVVAAAGHSQMFQLMHPSDHVGVTWNTKDLITSPVLADTPGNLTKWVWTEIPASGCKVNITHVECPEVQPGYTCNSITAAQLKKIATLNVTMVAAELSSDVDETGYEISAVTMR